MKSVITFIVHSISFAYKTKSISLSYNFSFDFTIIFHACVYYYLNRALVLLNFK